jgi:hypothetical protein
MNGSKIPLLALIVGFIAGSNQANYPLQYNKHHKIKPF